MTSIPCTALWWTARPLSVWNRLEQSVHWKGLGREAITSPPCTALLCSAQPLSVVNRFEQTVHSKALIVSREAMTSIPCTALWWKARPLSEWNRLEQSVHWKGLDREAITMWERKRSFSCWFCLYTFHTFMRISGLKEGNPLLRHTMRVIPNIAH